MLDLPITYFLSVLCFACALLLGLLRLNKPWGVPYVAVVLTVAAWYLIEPLEFADTFQFNFDQDDVQTAFGSVALFFIALAIVTPWLADKFTPKRVVRFLDEAYISAEHVLLVAAGLWLVLLAYGVARMGGDVLRRALPLKWTCGWSDVGAGGCSGCRT